MVSFERLWNSFCSPWDNFGLPFGTLWGALGSEGGLLGVTLASLWLPWDAGGPLWGTLGSQAELGLTLSQNGRPFPSILGAFAMPAHKK